MRRLVELCRVILCLLGSLAGSAIFLGMIVGDMRLIIFGLIVVVIVGIIAYNVKKAKKEEEEEQTQKSKK